MRVYVPISYTWDECYVINEIISGDDSEDGTYAFDVFHQYRFAPQYILEESNDEPMCC